MSARVLAASRPRAVPGLKAKGGTVIAGGTLAIASLNSGGSIDSTLIIVDGLGEQPDALLPFPKAIVP